jgi:deferrochelatase/peroxidase EfeB
MIPWSGVHQAGVTTDQQNNLVQLSLDVTSQRIGDVVALLRTWQRAIGRLTNGDPLSGYDLDDELFPSPYELSRPPIDTGEAVGQGPDQLTITVGFGPSLFDDRFGLTTKRPPALADLPRFSTDRLLPQMTGGDIGLQCCAMTKVTAEHAARSLARLARGVAEVRWAQSGFYEPPTVKGSPTTRNLMGYKDGTANLVSSDARQMANNVWVQPGDGPTWMEAGTYQVFRRIDIDLRRWDDSTLQTQQVTFGRYKASGAPFGGAYEFDPVNVAAMGSGAHVRLANPRDGQRSEDERILRRGFSFTDGTSYDGGSARGGLHFICFQRDPRHQFVSIQRRLASRDLLNKYVRHTGSAIFAVPPGVAKNGYVGQQLFET